MVTGKQTAALTNCSLHELSKNRSRSIQYTILAQYIRSKTILQTGFYSTVRSTYLLSSIQENLASLEVAIKMYNHFVRSIGLVLVLGPRALHFLGRCNIQAKLINKVLSYYLNTMTLRSIHFSICVGT